MDIGVWSLEAFIWSSIVDGVGWGRGAGNQYLDLPG
jgi:hypothetical protein